MKKILNFLKIIKTYFLVIVIGILLVVLYFKNNKITKLNTQLTELPKIEYVYNTITDTIKINVIKPVQVIKWKEIKDTLYVPLNLSTIDSIQLAEAYNKLFEEFGAENTYNNVIKDDSIARIELTEVVQYNKIQERIFMFTDRTPSVTITNTKYITNASIVAGIETDNFGGVGVGLGLVTKKNNFFKASYDVSNNEFSFGGYVNIINFRSK
jgi:hypothetical protein